MSEKDLLEKAFTGFAEHLNVHRLPVDLQKNAKSAFFAGAMSAMRELESGEDGDFSVEAFNSMVQEVHAYLENYAANAVKRAGVSPFEPFCSHYTLKEGEAIYRQVLLNSGVRKKHLKPYTDGFYTGAASAGGIVQRVLNEVDIQACIALLKGIEHEACDYATKHLK